MFVFHEGSHLVVFKLKFYLDSQNGLQLWHFVFFGVMVVRNPLMPDQFELLFGKFDYSNRRIHKPLWILRYPFAVVEQKRHFPLHEE